MERFTRVLAFLALMMPLGQACAQAFDENLARFEGEASVFTALTQNRVDTAAGTDAETEGRLGLEGSVAGEWLSGGNSVLLDYAAQVETSRNSDVGSGGDNSTITGLSRFAHADPSNPFEFNLGHTVRTVRNNTGFVIDPKNYDTQNIVNAGAGLRLNPGALTTVRVSADAARAYGDSEEGDTDSYTARVNLERRLSQRSFGLVNGSRSWSDEGATEVTIDAYQVGYRSVDDFGAFSIGGGVSEAETEFPSGLVTKSDGVTAFLTKDWVTTDWTTSFSYNRTLSDSAIDLVLNPETPDDFSENVRLNEVVLSDRFDLRHTRRTLCDVCDFSIRVSVEIRESQESGETTHELGAGWDLGIQITNLQRLEFRYLWQAETEENASEVQDQVHRFNSRWVRQLAEFTSFAVEFNQAYLASKQQRPDEEEYELRLVLSHGFSLIGQGR
ncbi:hypothetical protein J3362_05480 [Marinobacter sp. NFXS11]|uniref:hypothetical protein n=1 Tax=Marinobacter sp. NFXS11 TaxID=2818432 RepID=UPI0032E02CCF